MKDVTAKLGLGQRAPAGRNREQKEQESSSGRLVFLFDGCPDDEGVAVESIHGIEADHEAALPKITVTGPADVIAEALDIVEQDRA